VGVSARNSLQCEPRTTDAKEEISFTITKKHLALMAVGIDPKLWAKKKASKAYARQAPRRENGLEKTQAQAA